MTIDAQSTPRFYAGLRLAHLVGLVLGLEYLGAMMLAALAGYPLVGVGGSAAGLAAVIWAVRRDPVPPDAGRRAEGPGAS